jgi:hypothetical protein
MSLQEYGCDLYHLPELHAKMVLIPGAFASIGSQNATRRGTLNREATAVFTTPEAVAVICDLVKPWLDERQPITPDMIDDMNLALPPLARAMRKVQRACNALDAKLFEAELRRVEMRARFAKEERIRREAEEEAIRREVELLRLEEERLSLLRRRTSEVREELQKVCHNNSVDHAIASRFVADSTWWLTHRSGPVRARRYRYNLAGSEGSWSVRYGANTFHVAYALQRCAARLEHWLDQKLAGEGVTVEGLQESLRRDVRGSVSNFRGDLYDLYPVEGNDMKFGSISVDVADFVRCFLELTGLPERFSA